MGLIWNAGDGGREADYAQALAARAFGVKFKTAGRPGEVSPLPSVIRSGLPASLGEVLELAQRIDGLRSRAPLAFVLDLSGTAQAQPALPSAAEDGAPVSDRPGLLASLEPALRACIEQQLLPRASVTIAALRSGDLASSIPGHAPFLAADLRAAGASGAIVCNGALAVLAGQDQAPASLPLAWLDTPQARGWLRTAPRASISTPLATHTAALAPYHDAALYSAALAAALALDFNTADAAVLAQMAVAAGEPQPGFALNGSLLPLFDIAPGKPVLSKPGFAPLTRRDMGLYAVVDSADWVERVLAAGVQTVQLRAKQGTPALLSREIARCVKAAHATGAQLFINDHWELALEHQAYGVHLGQEDLLSADLGVLRRAGMRIGISTHSYWEVCRALALQPSYIACGPVYPTTTKDMPWIPQGPGNVAYWSRTLAQPVVAIGGMDEARGAEAARCGAAGVAVLRGIVNAQDPAAAIGALQRAIADRSAGLLRAPALPRSTLRWRD